VTSPGPGAPEPEILRYDVSVTFRCTEKVRRRLRLSPAALADVPEMVEAAEWHCNVLTLARRPAYLVTHSLSLFSVLFLAAGASTPETLAEAIRGHVRRALTREGIALDAARRILDEGPDHFCKATDRGVLGSMTDFALMADSAAYEENSADPDLLVHTADSQLNESPMSRLGMDSPRSVLRALLQPRGTA
jgi:uncharacterized protein DUF6933